MCSVTKTKTRSNCSFIDNSRPHHPLDLGPDDRIQPVDRRCPPRPDRKDRLQLFGRGPADRRAHHERIRAHVLVPWRTDRRGAHDLLTRDRRTSNYHRHPVFDFGLPHFSDPGHCVEQYLSVLFCCRSRASTRWPRRSPPANTACVCTRPTTMRSASFATRSITCRTKSPAPSA